MKTEYVNIAVSRELNKALKQIALDEDITLQDLVGDVLVKYVKEVAKYERNNNEADETV
jgi:chaperonin cofactor prefoldin